MQCVFRRYIIVELIAIIVAVQSSPCHAAFVLDQQYEPPPPPGGSSNQFNEDGPAQTFTVGVSGTLDRVDVLVSRLQSEGSLLLEVQDTTADGKPFVSGALRLATGSVPLSEVPSSNAGGPGPRFVAVDLSASNLHVDEGDVLAILVRRDRGGSVAIGGISWRAGLTSREPEYPGGAAWEFFPGAWRRSESGRFSDYGFRTYVTPVPEPAAGALVLTASAWLLRRRRA